MAFKTLFHQPNPEFQLLEQVAAILQGEYELHQNTYFFLKLGRSGEKGAEILWQKSFSRLDALSDFTFDTVLRRACILVKFETDKYRLACFGFSMTQEMNVYPAEMESGSTIEVFGDIEEKPMPSKELLKGFDEIAGCLRFAPLKKSV